MKFLNELLGFAVLTGPLWLILIVLAIAVWIAAKVTKRFERRSAKITVGALVFLLVFFVPFADEIAGRIYLSYLCATEAGVKVYKTVELPAKYWDERGRAKFLRANGDLDKTILGNRFGEPAVKKPYSYALGIDDYRQQVVDNTTNETLGEVVNFLHWGGSISRNLSPSSSAVDCKNLHGNKFWADFHSSLFDRSNSVK
ncbi:MAG: hypothetical protein HY527_22625 [Betaproteobacteria bacterium]|nr:hypothetical protein [Betaproteobacteria bacterium]